MLDILSEDVNGYLFSFAIYMMRNTVYIISPMLVGKFHILDDKECERTF